MYTPAHGQPSYGYHVRTANPATATTCPPWRAHRQRAVGVTDHESRDGILRHTNSNSGQPLLVQQLELRESLPLQGYLRFYLLQLSPVSLVGGWFSEN